MGFLDWFGNNDDEEQEESGGYVVQAKFGNLTRSSADRLQIEIAEAAKRHRDAHGQVIQYDEKEVKSLKARARQKALRDRNNE